MLIQKQYKKLVLLKIQEEKATNFFHYWSRVRNSFRFFKRNRKSIMILFCFDLMLKYDMTRYNTLNVKLYNSQLIKLKSEIKNGTEVTLNFSSNLTGNSNDGTNFLFEILLTDTAQKMKFFFYNFFSKRDQIRSFLWIWSHFLKKSLIGKRHFLCIVIYKL